MGFHRMLGQGTWVAVLLSGMAAAAVVAQLALPNCPDRCGDVEIPYPFGIAKGCCLNDDFVLRCNHSSGVVRRVNIIVTNISIQGQLEILMYVAHQCFNNTGVNSYLRVPAFTISNTQNVFMAVGCDTYAFLNGFQNNDPFHMGCISTCESITNIVKHSCSEVGCCQVEIPPGLKNFSLQANSFQNHTGIFRFSPCSYAFVVKKYQFSFSSDYPYSLKDNEMLPMVLDWAVGNKTYEYAQSKSDYVCGGNTTCYDPHNGYGYRCKCKDSYDGNPYLHLGCQDINECDSINACADNATCTNFPGSFSCTCNDGYEGDRTNVTSCIPVNQSRGSNYVIKTALGYNQFGLQKLGQEDFVGYSLPAGSEFHCTSSMAHSK